MADDTIQVVACSVFRDALIHLKIQSNRRPWSFRFLPSHLHLRPAELKTQLVDSIRQARSSGDCIGCLYGTCFPDIDGCLKPSGALRIAGAHCYEVLLGPRRYAEVIAAAPGSFFVEKELLLDFDSLCRIPLELDDPDIRGTYFKHYRQVVYIRQPRDPDLTGHAGRVADLLNLDLKILDADYRTLQRFLKTLLGHSSNTALSS